MNTTPEQVEQGITFLQAWTYGGPLMWVLAGLSVIALTLILYLLIAHRRGALASTAMVSDVISRMAAKDYGEARRLCERRPCAFAALALAALDVLRTGKPAPQHVATAIETAGSHVAERLQGTVDYLCDIAAVAPLVGLLGTVLGMFQAFGGIANDLAAAARPVVLAQGVSQAIVTTMFGLVVAIPCLAAYAFLRRRTARRIAELESIAVELERAAE